MQLEFKCSAEGDLLSCPSPAARLMVKRCTDPCFPCPLQEINYDSPRGGVSVITEKGELTTSYLLVQRARVSDSGKYTCTPSNANPSTVSVHILSGTYTMRLQP